ncbi:hypothetical protein PUN28_018363 [Cardiocondyla obscurior]|uniref:Uncharacterized protein n=1 Tax=Cardiocondyla obscurior TaxID=286306 RepID=A0AAW2EIJ4_9HYME
MFAGVLGSIQARPPRAASRHINKAAHARTHSSYSRSLSQILHTFKDFLFDVTARVEKKSGLVAIIFKLFSLFKKSNIKISF